MRSPHNKFDCPKWLQITCCLVTLGAFGGVAYGIAVGHPVPSIAIAGVTGLCWQVIAASLGLPPASFAMLRGKGEGTDDDVGKLPPP